MLRIRALLVALLCLLPIAATAQSIQFDAGQIFGNSTAATRNGRAESVTAILDRALGSTRGSVLERGAASWGIVAPSATVGLPWVSNGTGADPAYQVLTPVGGGTGITALGAGIATWLGTPTSANLFSAMTDKTGTGGLLVFSTSPAIPSIFGGNAAGSSISIASTSNGAPSGDTTSIFGSAITIGSAVVATGTVNIGGSAGGGVNVNIGNATNGLNALNVYNNVGVKQIWIPGGGNTTISFPTVTSTLFGTGDVASSSQLEAGTANKILDGAGIYDAEKTVTFAASQTLDFSTFLNARLTLTANITSLTCSNIKASQSGAISLVQDGTGNRTVVAGWCSQFRWSGGVRGVLSTAANAIDALFYQCVSTSICYVSLSKAQAN